MTNPPPLPETRLSLHQAARLVAGKSLRATENALIEAIERGELAADVVRWATEQWDGDRLEGNLDHRRTTLSRADLERWLAGRRT